MSPSKKNIKPISSDRPSRRSAASTPSSSTYIATPIASKSKSTIPFLSFSTKPDPRLKEEENVQDEVEHSEDENLLNDSGRCGLLKKQSKHNVPKPEEHSTTRNRFLSLTPEVNEPKKENVQSRAGTFATDVQEKEVQFEDGIPPAIDPSLQGHSSSRLSSTNVPRDAGHSHQFPAAAKVPSLPDHAEHTPMSGFTKVSPQLGQSSQNFGATFPLAVPTNYPLMKNSHMGQETSFISPQKTSSDKDLPFTVKQPHNQHPSMSDSELPSTGRDPFRQHGRSISGLPSGDMNAFARRPDLHPMTSITRQQQQQQQQQHAAANSAPTGRGRPSQSAKAQMLALADPFGPQQGGQEIRRTASAGPSRPAPNFVPNPAPAPAPATATASYPPKIPDNSSKTFYILTHYRLENTAKDFRYLIGAGPLVVSQNPQGYVSHYTLTRELNNQAHSLKNWFGIQEEMAKSTRTVPATLNAPGFEQKLELKRVVLRYDFGCGLDEETAGPYDTPISDTQELDRALHLMARRNWKDVLVAYFGLGDPIPLMQYDSKGKGKRVERDDEEDRTSKKSKTSRDSSVEIIGSSSRMR
jgi:hypothetical protein